MPTTAEILEKINVETPLPRQSRATTSLQPLIDDPDSNWPMLEELFLAILDQNDWLTDQGVTTDLGAKVLSRPEVSLEVLRRVLKLKRPRWEWTSRIIEMPLAVYQDDVDILVAVVTVVTSHLREYRKQCQPAALARLHELDLAGGAQLNLDQLRAIVKATKHNRNCRPWFIYFVALLFRILGELTDARANRAWTQYIQTVKVPLVTRDELRAHARNKNRRLRLARAEEETAARKLFLWLMDHHFEPTNS